jgi:hypothetical protein
VRLLNLHWYVSLLLLLLLLLLVLLLLQGKRRPAHCYIPDVPVNARGGRRDSLPLRRPQGDN